MSHSNLDPGLCPCNNVLFEDPCGPSGWRGARKRGSLLTQPFWIAPGPALAPQPLGHPSTTAAQFPCCDAASLPVSAPSLLGPQDLLHQEGRKPAVLALG